MKSQPQSSFALSLQKSQIPTYTHSHRLNRAERTSKQSFREILIASLNRRFAVT